MATRTSCGEAREGTGRSEKDTSFGLLRTKDLFCLCQIRVGYLREKKRESSWRAHELLDMFTISEQAFWKGTITHSNSLRNGRRWGVEQAIALPVDAL